jgi:hypothetical protein
MLRRIFAMNMKFDPDSFERIKTSIDRIPRKCKLAVVDTFALYMRLQLSASGDRYAEHKTTLEAVRPTFSKTNDRRKDKDIIYFLEVLKDTGMITYESRGNNIYFRISEFDDIEPSKSGKERKPVLIWRSNRHIMEDYHSNVPFAFYCLLQSLRRGNSGIHYTVRISFMEISRRLDISPDTLDKNKRILEKDGYIYTIVGSLYKNEQGYQQECNEYYVYSFNHRRPPEKNQLYKMKKTRRREKTNGQEAKSGDSASGS